MAHRRSPIALAPALVLSLALGACKDNPLPAPDPKGDDLVIGAVVAAVTTSEPTPGVRIYKIVRADTFPPPMPRRLYMIAYDPKAPTFEDAARAWKAGGMKVALDRVEVALPLFLTRDHRVIAVEPVTMGDGGK
jgi:hypothetical protein